MSLAAFQAIIVGYFGCQRNHISAAFKFFLIAYTFPDQLFICYIMILTVLAVIYPRCTNPHFSQQLNAWVHKRQVETVLTASCEHRHLNDLCSVIKEKNKALED